MTIVAILQQVRRLAWILLIANFVATIAFTSEQEPSAAKPLAATDSGIALAVEHERLPTVESILVPTPEYGLVPIGWVIRFPYCAEDWSNTIGQSESPENGCYGILSSSPSFVDGKIDVQLTDANILYPPVFGNASTAKDFLIHMNYMDAITKLAAAGYDANMENPYADFTDFTLIDQAISNEAYPLAQFLTSLETRTAFDGQSAQLGRARVNHSPGLITARTDAAKIRARDQAITFDIRPEVLRVYPAE